MSRPYKHLDYGQHQIVMHELTCQSLAYYTNELCVYLEHIHQNSQMETLNDIL